MDFLGKIRPVHAANADGDPREPVPEALLPVKDFLKEELADAEKDLENFSRPESPAEKARIEELLEEEGFEWDADTDRELLIDIISEVAAKIKTLKGITREFYSGKYQPTLDYIDSEIKNIETNTKTMSKILGRLKIAKFDIDKLKQIRDFLQTYISQKT